MRTALLVLPFFCLPGLAVAAEPVGCEKFSWSVQDEQRLLAEPARSEASGAVLAAAPPVAVRLALKPYASADLIKPPERAPRVDPSNAGFLTIPISRAGEYKVTLSGEAWVDAIQGDHYGKPLAFTGATGCSGVRKSVKFRLEGKPLTLQLSGTGASEISVVVTPAE